ncbi:hypothetical protein GOPIP_025_00590 [Gordonia polyisoprenivorans NBRC 16320 = JCM 10675]|uniref:G domain-containing protein n=1 Tax=Gordonia polyisoprenivorans TaxID=84595 RepID=A0A846WRR1_9ACTN|nr:GTPase [Gordonia polyisoprenivorans]NKY03021.1 hypothetical protein [Gordonia polyisoprenivorans]GAB22169.1 hypothetical protein GOPIP_025_00590 [Gordonia polyisoprenivorans NBRC 16320 = JCM 10675]
MTTINSAEQWVLSSSDAESVAKCREGLAEFTRQSKPIVTVLGSYDTGKSSLIRRILVDSGVSVPEWLTISARHETFAVNQIDCGGYIVRDTPGLAIGADDARATSNTSDAFDAVTTTDIAVITVSPQLATGERDALLDLISVGWAPGTLWFVIGRFDEAGVPFDSDPDGYRGAAERKTRELRDSLKLDPGVPVFVVSQDFEQIGGPDRDLDSDTWEESREWDGMASLEDALTSITQDRRDFLRDAAVKRFWAIAAKQVAQGLAGERQDLKTLEGVADRAAKQLELWDDQLNTLSRAAASALDSEIDQESARLTKLQSDLASVTTALTQVLDRWHAKQTQSLDLLLQDVDFAQTTEKASPDWQDLSDILQQATVGATAAAQGPDPIFSKVTGRLGPVIVGALTDYAKLSRQKTLKARGSALPADTEWSAPKYAAAAAAGLPLLQEVAGFVDDERAKAAAKAQYAAQLSQYAQLTKQKADEQWAITIDHARNRVQEAFGEQAGTLPVITDRIAQIDSALQQIGEWGR